MHRQYSSLPKKRPPIKGQQNFKGHLGSVPMLWKKLYPIWGGGAIAQVCVCLYISLYISFYDSAAIIWDLSFWKGVRKAL